MLLVVMAFTANAQTKKYLGGDASLLPSYQEKGTVYKDFDGHKVKFLPFVKQQGWDMIRVRLFVDPQNAPEGHKGEGVCQDLNYVIGLCQQINAKTLGRLQQATACRQCLCLHSCFATSDETSWHRARDDTGWQ